MSKMFEIVFALITLLLISYLLRKAVFFSFLDNAKNGFRCQ